MRRAAVLSMLIVLPLLVGGVMFVAPGSLKYGGIAAGTVAAAVLVTWPFPPRGLWPEDAPQQHMLQNPDRHEQRDDRDR